MYLVKDIFYSLQGEGANAGRAAVFCRFAVCNLACDFCDTDFSAKDLSRGGRFDSAAELSLALLAHWPDPRVRPFVVCTGGEPLLQLDQPLVDALHAGGFEIAVETNGTRQPPAGVDWICVSPKRDSELILRQGNELKFIYPQDDFSPESFEDLAFDHFFLQPMDGPEKDRNTAAAVQYCLAHPKWRLSFQLHKLLRIP